MVKNNLKIFQKICVTIFVLTLCSCSYPKATTGSKPLAVDFTTGRAGDFEKDFLGLPDKLVGGMTRQDRLDFIKYEKCVWAQRYKPRDGLVSYFSDGESPHYRSPECAFFIKRFFYSNKGPYYFVNLRQSYAYDRTPSPQDVRIVTRCKSTNKWIDVTDQFLDITEHYKYIYFWEEDKKRITASKYFLI